ncbi:CaiB/BaiF CoA transferase family protein [Chloroflexota bacterium]
MSGPLDGIRVLDMGAFSVGPQACGLLGLLGAEVIRIEPDYGDGLMRVAPFIDGMGTTYLVSHNNSKSIVLDLKKKAEKDIAYALIKHIDIFVENRRVGAFDRLGFGYDVVSKINPNIIYVSSSGYGHTGPWIKYGATDPFIQAMSGFASLNGQFDGEPQLSRYTALVDGTGSVAITQACLVALVQREKTRRGQYVDMDEFSSSLFMQSTRIAEYFATRQEPRRMGSESSKVCPSKAYLAQDNQYILISALTRPQWVNLCAALEMSELVDDERFATNGERLKHRDEVNKAIQERIQDKPMVWWLWQLSRYNVPHSKILNVEDIVQDPHVQANNYIVDLPSAWGPLKYANNTPWEFKEAPLNETTASPYPDADRDYVFSLIKDSRTPQGALEVPAADSTPPLEGIRVLDLTQGIAGPMCTAQLGNLGAEVIKIEKDGGDFSREWGPLINGESAIFMQLNHDKKSIAVDYRTPEGLGIMRELVKKCDIFIEDLKPGEAECLGIGYDDLRLLKKDLIYCSIYPFGDKGPYRDKEVTELEIQGMSGMMRWIGEPGQEPVRLGADICSALTGMFTFSSIMAAIYNKIKRHRGEKLVNCSLAGAIHMMQHGILPLSGVDFWDGYWATGPYDLPLTGISTSNNPTVFTVMVRDKEQGRATLEKICKAIGLSERLEDPEFVNKASGLKAMGSDAQEMKPIFESAFRNWDADELVDKIDECGGLAAKVLTYKDLFDPLNEQVKANGMVVEQEHPRARKIQLINNPWRHSDGIAEIKAPSPALGEHTEAIMAMLGYSEEQIKRLGEISVIR